MDLFFKNTLKAIFLFIALEFLFLMGSNYRVMAVGCFCGPGGVGWGKCEPCFHGKTGPADNICCFEGGESCFTPETVVETTDGSIIISELKEGDQLISLDIKTDGKVSNAVEKVYDASQNAYYKIELEDGQEVKVTGEHPLYAKPGEIKPLNFWEYLKTESLVKKALDKLANF